MSKFHDEFFRHGSPVHDALMIKCLSKDGIDKIVRATGAGGCQWPENIPRTIYRVLCQTKTQRVIWNECREELVEGKWCERCEYKDDCEKTHIAKINLLGRLCPQISIKKETEVIIRNGTFILGYADAVITVECSYQIYYHVDDTWAPIKLGPYNNLIETILVEAKPEITSIGEVVRQLKTYALLMASRTPYKIIATYSKLGEDALEYLANENIIVVQFDRS